METVQLPQTPALTHLSLSRLCAQYLRDQFRFKLNARSFPMVDVATAPRAPMMMPEHLVTELDRIALILVDAFFNRG